MKLEFTLPFWRRPVSQTAVSQPSAPLPRQAPRVARLVALAHKLDGLVRSGAVSDYGAVARLGHISQARLTQILVLLHLSPAIQEQILFLPAAEARFVPELELRRIAREPLWSRQWDMFEQLQNKAQGSWACHRMA